MRSILDVLQGSEYAFHLLSLMKIHIKQHQSITYLLTESVSEYVIDFLNISLLKFTSLITIDDFGVSDTILLGDANSAQTSMKCLDLACDDESPPLKSCKDLIMKLEVKYLFPTSCSGASFYIYQLPEGLAMRKILHMVLGCKRIHKLGRTFQDFHGFSWSYASPKSNLHPPTESIARKIFEKGLSKSISRMMQYANFQLYRTYLTGFIWKNRQMMANI